MVQRGGACWLEAGPAAGAGWEKVTAVGGVGEEPPAVARMYPHLVGEGRSMQGGRRRPFTAVGSNGGHDGHLPKEVPTLLQQL